MSSGFNEENKEKNGNLKYDRVNIELRRGRVLELSAQGYNGVEISKSLGVSPALVSLDLQYLRAKAKENIHNYIDEKLPEEYHKCFVGINAILKEAWTMKALASDARERRDALSLAKDCYHAKIDLLTNVDVVEDIIKYVNNKMGKLKTEDGNTENISKCEKLEKELQQDIPDELESEQEQDDDIPGS